MVGWDRFHQKVVEVQPPEHSIEPDKYIVAVLLVGKSPEQSLDEYDFIWIRANRKITIEKIAEVHLKEVPEKEIDLWFNDTIPSSETLVKDLDIYDDRFVSLRAVERPSHFAAPTSASSTAPGGSPEKGVAALSGTPHTPAPGESIGRSFSQSEPLPLPSHKNVVIEEAASSMASQFEEIFDTHKQEPEGNPLLKNHVPSSQCEPPEEDNKADIHPVDHLIRQLITKGDAEILEAGVEVSMEILGQLREIFVKFADLTSDAGAWIDSVDKIKVQSKRAPTVVGVVGNTGAGKSSVINAVLDEEQLVPTNCVRACTAVVTELSWNHSPDPGSKYRAEIEFINRDDWEKELKILLEDCLTENGTLSSDHSRKDTEAGIAWAKFHAVYPQITKDSLGKCAISELMGRQELGFLGTTKHVEREEPGNFYLELQKYVDSKDKNEKSTGKETKKRKRSKQESGPRLEYWPLIKVVKIYTKSPALSTGAVIVDLPGVHDSNAARSAVAERYMKQCSGLWIVAPITRAVDDKAAKTLLGDSFKRQLQYDGTYSDVSFICSKTDDISSSEAVKSLGLDDDDYVVGLQEEHLQLQGEIEDIDSRMSDAKELVDDYQTSIDTLQEEIELWDGFQDRVENGEKVFPPRVKEERKRKKSELQLQSHGLTRKRPKVAYTEKESDEDFEISETDGCDSDIELYSSRQPLSPKEIEEKLRELKSRKKIARQEKAKAKETINEWMPSLQGLKAKSHEIQNTLKAICIDQRNQYSKAAVQQDFAAGIRDLDNDIAIENDEENWNPEEELRDYNEVANSLPVFCVSSRAYQKMCGRLKMDERVVGFKTKEDTEIPQLQKHCQNLTATARIQSSRAFLLALCQHLNTFNFWSSNGSTGLVLSNSDKKKELDYFKNRLSEVEIVFEKAVAKCVGAIKEEISELFKRMPKYIKHAIRAAPERVSKWGDHTNGGVRCMTYKAIVRRGGAYHSASAGHRDFNADLLDPITRKLALSWERTFKHRFPEHFGTLLQDCKNGLQIFYSTMEERVKDGVGLAIASILKGSVSASEQIFCELNHQLVDFMTEAQRTANRGFNPALAKAMKHAYDVCARESGNGCFRRMKDHMIEFVEQERHQMFGVAIEEVKIALEKMCADLKHMMTCKAEEIASLICTDYERVLDGGQVNQSSMPEHEKKMRDEVSMLLKQFNRRFQNIVDDGIVGEDLGTTRMETTQPSNFQHTASELMDMSPVDENSGT